MTLILSNFSSSTMTATLGNSILYDLNTPITFEACQNYCLNAVVVDVHNTIIVFFAAEVLLWTMFILAAKLQTNIPDVITPKVLQIMLSAGWLFSVAFVVVVLYAF